MLDFIRKNYTASRIPFSMAFRYSHLKDRLSETHGVKLNSKSREIDVRIIQSINLIGVRLTVV